MITNGIYFKLNYNIIINKTKDIEGYTLEEYIVDKVDLTEDGIGFNCNGYYNLFSDNEAHKIDGKLVYVEKISRSYEYYPNQLFQEFYHTNWDIDDFGDTDEGWDEFIEANEDEYRRYEDSIRKINYEGFIVSTDENVINEVLNKITKEFCKVNDINYMEEK